MTTPADQGPAVPTPEDRDVAGAEATGPRGCDWFQSVAAEFALGSLTGAERSFAIAHLEVCESCLALVKSLSVAADALLLVAPELDPPAGFEVRLLEVMRSRDLTSAKDPRRGEQEAIRPGAARQQDGAEDSNVIPLRRRKASLLRVAAVAVVFGAAGVAVGAAVDNHPASHVASSSIRMADLKGVGSEASLDMGQVVVSGGNPAWILMTFEKSGWSGWVSCVVTSGGHSKVVGAFPVHHGYGSWAVQLATAGDAVTAAKIVTQGGEPMAVATLG
jgi:hypothetical protein